MNDPTLRLLVIAEHEEDVQPIVTELRNFGFEVFHHQAFSTEEILSSLQREAWDLVISGHRLGCLTSLEALNLVVSHGYDIPFIVIADVRGEEGAIAAIRAGAYDCILRDNLSRLGAAAHQARANRQGWRTLLQSERELRDSQQQLRELAAHLESVREQERAIIAREVHDDLGSTLMALKLDLAWLRRHHAAESATGDKLDSMGKLVDGAIHSMRRIITELRPSVLDDIGLLAAIEWQLQAFAERTGLECSLDNRVDEELLGNSAHEIGVYRILQESLTNVLRHAQARHVEVSMENQAGELVMSVRDDGRGIDAGALRKSGSFGILGMHERARHLGGSVLVEQGTPTGTVVTLRIPLR